MVEAVEERGGSPSEDLIYMLIAADVGKCAAPPFLLFYPAVTIHEIWRISRQSWALGRDIAR